VAVEKRFREDGRLVEEHHWDRDGNEGPFGRTGMPEGRLGQ
jgi:hypothetical protein